MRAPTRLLWTAWLAVFLLACGSAAPARDTTAPPTETILEKPAEPAAGAPTEAAAGAAAEPDVDNSPAWLDLELRDVNSGQTFKLSDFKGQIVLVEAMAVWCTNCMAQQRELVRLHEQIGDAAISVAIDVDLNEDEALLKQHAEINGFDWRYAVAPPELAQALAAEFGNAFLNPPSVPMFLIDKQGGVHLLDFGHKTADYLSAQIQAYQ